MSWHSRSSSRSCASPGTRRRGPRAKAAWDTEPAGAAVLAAVRAWKLSGSSLQSCRAGCVLLLAGAPRRALYVTGICSAVVTPLLSPPWHSRCPGLLPKLMHCYHGETQATASCCPLRTRAARYGSSRAGDAYQDTPVPRTIGHKLASLQSVSYPLSRPNRHRVGSCQNVTRLYHMCTHNLIHKEYHDEKRPRRSRC